MADAGWDVTFLSAPIDGMQLELPYHPHIDRIDVPPRPSHVMTKRAYFAYCARAVALSKRLKPSVVYASDPLGAFLGIMAARSVGARLIYHEHDSPNSQTDLNRLFAWARRRATRGADVVVFPNGQRAAVACEQLGFDPDRLRIVWNLPRRNEIPDLARRDDQRIVVYYHGSIVPDRLPLAVPKALQAVARPVSLRIAGYETASGKGYVAALEKEFGRASEGGLIEYISQIPLRSDLLRSAANANVGLALVSMSCDDINMRNMTGASNKAFDYMAAGLPLIVSDLPDWRAMFVDPGHALAADPRDPDSLAAALRMLIDNPQLRFEMGYRNRKRIAAEWNYEIAFAPILAAFT
jgi:glycosyltransferase involved in cell wall biosynthesis